MTTRTKSPINPPLNMRLSYHGKLVDVKVLASIVDGPSHLNEVEFRDGTRREVQNSDLVPGASK